MKTNQIIIALVLIFVCIIVVYNLTQTSQPSKNNYAEEIKQKRKEKDFFFKQSESSPIPQRNTFHGLSYFEPNEKYKINTKLELIPNPKNISIVMSSGESELYLGYAWANFTWDNKKYRMLLLRRNMQEKMLFLAFTDATSGKETYKGGRYLDLPYSEEMQEILIDFNLGYHPYCVYNSNYACPIPPKENILDFEVLAGEKLEKTF